MKLKKNKIWLLGLGAGLMATTGIVTPLIVSCSSNDPSKPQDTDGSDKKYNITQATYDNLEKQLIFKYQHKKMAEGLLGDSLKDDMNNLSIQLNSLRKESNKVSYNYTFRTNCLIDLAIKNYGIQISRGFSSSLDADFLSEQENYGNAYRRYLLNNHFSPTNANTLVRSFNSNFRTLKENICAQFDDPLYSLNQLKENLLSCFDDATKELEYAHTQQLISQFFNEYNFTYNGTALFDSFNFSKNANIKELIPKIFNCTKVSTGELITLDENWTTTLVPNHIIKPILRNFRSSIYTNIHWIQVEWGLMPSKYVGKDPVEQEKATAYYSSPKKETFEKKVNSLDDYLNLKDDEKTYVITKMHISKELEKENIKKAYGDLTFSFSTDRNDHAYEEFGVCINQSGETVDGGLGGPSLAKTGLMIQEKDDKSPILVKNTVNKLCDLVKHNSKSIESGEYKPTLKEKFLLFTDFGSVSRIVNDNEHKVSTDIYASYKNSPYKQTDDKDLTVKLNVQSFEATGIVYSSQFYENSLGAFNQVRKLRDTLLDLASSDNKLIVRFSVTIGILVVLSVLNGYCIAKSLFLTFISPINKTFAVVTLVIAILLEISSLTMMGVNIYGLANVIKNKLAVNALITKKDGTFQTINDKIEQDKYMYDNKEVFLLSPSSKVQPSVSYFKNFSSSDDYKTLVKDAEDLSADKTAFEEKVDSISKVVHYIELGLGVALIGCLIPALVIQNRQAEAVEEETTEKALEREVVTQTEETGDVARVVPWNGGAQWRIVYSSAGRETGITMPLSLGELHEQWDVMRNFFEFHSPIILGWY